MNGIPVVKGQKVHGVVKAWQLQPRSVDIKSHHTGMTLTSVETKRGFGLIHGATITHVTNTRSKNKRIKGMSVKKRQ